MFVENIAEVIPEMPFMKLVMDIAKYEAIYQGKIYWTVYDFYSRWLEVNAMRISMRDITAKSVI